MPTIYIKVLSNASATLASRDLDPPLYNYLPELESLLDLIEVMGIEVERVLSVRNLSNSYRRLATTHLKFNRHQGLHRDNQRLHGDLLANKGQKNAPPVSRQGEEAQGIKWRRKRGSNPQPAA